MCEIHTEGIWCYRSPLCNLWIQYEGLYIYIYIINNEKRNGVNGIIHSSECLNESTVHGNTQVITAYFGEAFCSVGYLRDEAQKELYDTNWDLKSKMLSRNNSAFATQRYTPYNSPTASLRIAGVQILMMSIVQQSSLVFLLHTLYIKRCK